MESPAFFSIPYRVALNVTPLPEGSTLPEQAQFESRIPDIFRLASDVATLDSSALRGLRLVGDTARELADYLNLLSRKINAVMGHVLMQQDQAEFRHYSRELGADQLVIDTLLPHSAGTLVELKLFVSDENVAIFALGEVVSHDDDSTRIRFVRLREQDQELLIRATLHQQTRLLRERAARKEQP